MKESQSASVHIWLTPAEAAVYLGISTGTLARWRCMRNGTGPRWHTPAVRMVRYTTSDLDAWLNRSSQPARPPRAVAG